MALFTIRIVNTNKVYGINNYIYAFKYKYQAYNIVRQWFIRKKDIANNIIEIQEHCIQTLPTNVDIYIPCKTKRANPHGDFFIIDDERRNLEQLYDL